MRARGATLPLLCLAALWLGGCAPRRLEVPNLNQAPRQERFRAALEERERRLQAAEAELSLWIASGSRRFPGANARLLLAGPGAFRLRIESALSVALDVTGNGESLKAYLPRERLVVALADSLDSLGISKPGAFICRLMGAAFRPPAAAWDAGAFEDSLLVLRWSEASDSVEIAIGAHGLPLRARVGRPSAVWLVRYARWEALEGTWWPTVVEFEDEGGRLRVQCRVHRVRFRRAFEPARLVLETPPRVTRATLGDLRAALRRLGYD